MTERLSSEQEPLPELSTSTKRRIVQEYVLAETAGSESCTGFFGDIGNDPEEVKERIHRIIREATHNTNSEVTEQLLADINQKIAATEPNAEYAETAAEAYLGELTDQLDEEQRVERERRRASAEQLPPPPATPAPAQEIGGAALGRRRFWHRM